MKELQTPPEDGLGPRLARLNDLELDLIQAIRSCPTMDQSAVLDAVRSIVRSITKTRGKGLPKAEVLVLCDPLRKFPRSPV